MDQLFSVPDMSFLAHVASRLGIAALLGGLIGIEREWMGKAAGLRTHMTVALGCAAFMLIAIESSTDQGSTSRAIQGIAAGIGFIGAGTILKLTQREEIKGLTTAASIWLTAAVGVGAGIGPLWVPVVCAGCAWIILDVFARVEKRIGSRNRP